jgi:hypothetical protein
MKISTYLLTLIMIIMLMLSCGKKGKPTLNDQAYNYIKIGLNYAR